MKSSVVFASVLGAVLSAVGAEALNSIPYTINLLPSDPMLAYQNGRSRPTDSGWRSKWNLTYDNMNWTSYKPGDEWSDKTRWALAPPGVSLQVPLWGQRVIVEGVSLTASSCEVDTSFGDNFKDTFALNLRGRTTGAKVSMQYTRAVIKSMCENYAVLAVYADTLVNISQKSIEAATHQTQAFVGGGDQLNSPFFQQSGNVGVVRYNDSDLASVPNLGWVSFKTPQYASLMTIRGIACYNCSQIMVQMDPRPSGMKENPLLASYSPFTGEATMFVTPLDPGTEYTFNLTGIHDDQGGVNDALLLKNIEFVLSENANVSSSNAGAIAGGVVGGVLGAALLGVLGWWLWRRKRRNAVGNLKDVSVVDLTQGEHGQMTKVTTGQTATGSEMSSAMALGELPTFQAPGTSYPMSSGTQSPYTEQQHSPYAGPLQSPLYGPTTPVQAYGPSFAHSHPSTPEHPSTDIPRREISDLDDYFQARDSYIDPQWEEEEGEEAMEEPELSEVERQAKEGAPSPPPAPPIVTQERDAGRLVALPRPRSVALPEYRPRSQFITDGGAGAPQASSGPSRRQLPDRRPL